ncbi:MAG: nitrite/sulfite reductase [Myxococcales bacterium]|nr:nitrite/sulfite reductase [Myxococcales bacterium]MCB9530209.1 nitrite/sulfite reductase [Myxococcales bacterium]MCB9533722.1 nitrite/sulfite reductase [Myxococcales bacterium]
MYRYDEDDIRIVRERVEQFRDQVRRRLSGELSEDEFRPLRLQNGLYHQRHAYMLRVAIPYGMLSSRQLRQLAYIARRYDKGYGHISTRQNIQFNWPLLEEVPDLLSDLADVEMHAIQTSGNCIRNVTSDALAGVAGDELEDPRPYCELIRQWSTFHPEFAYLPRKFKIAVTGATVDRAAVAFHDIGLRLVRSDSGEVGFQVIVGGGLGRTPLIGQVVREFVSKRDILSYCEAVLRVYNLGGDRENKYKARIKIQLKTAGIDAFRAAVEAEWDRVRDTPIAVPEAELDRLRAFFEPPAYEAASRAAKSWDAESAVDPEFARWLRHNTSEHKVPGYRVVHISLKAPGVPPGDITADQLDALAALSDSYSFGEARTTHQQNMVLADVAQRDLADLWRGLRDAGLATPNIGTLTDMICCPGLDFCSLANAGSIAVARRIDETFQDLDELYDLGEVQLKLSGCINACGHHHIGHIGILGINKAGEEYYQIMLGGAPGDDASLGRWIGPAVAQDEIAPAVDRLVRRYVEQRANQERFIDTYRRVGAEPFKEAVYGIA